MDAATYNRARATLGLSNAQVAAWLGVNTRTCEKWANVGPSGPAAVAIRMRLGLESVRRWDTDWCRSELVQHDFGWVVKNSDIAAIIALGGGE